MTMPPRLRQLTGREVLIALTGFGFEVVSTSGTQAKLERILPSGEGQILTIPTHQSLDLVTIRAIFRQATRFVPAEELKHWFFGN